MDMSLKSFASNSFVQGARNALSSAARRVQQTPAPRKLRWLRRISQSFFLALFLLSLLHYGRLAAPLLGQSWPATTLRLFFQIDPLAALLSAVGGRTLNAGFWWLLPVLLGSALLGRFFCGWACPLGTLNHLFSFLPFGKKKAKVAIQRNHFHPWQAAKYYILAFGLIAALFGSAVLGWLDPLAILQRGAGFVFLPAAHHVATEAVQNTAAVVSPDAARGLKILWARSFFGAHISVFKQGLGVAFVLVAILLANVFITRLWCRFLCPLGALLGSVSWLSPLTLKKDASRCNGCSRCMIHCQSADQPKVGLPWRKRECHLCLNCVATCPSKSLEFAFEKKPAGADAPADLNRRLFATSVGAGVVVFPILHSAPGYAGEANPQLIRPPGAVAEESFLARCVRCGNCIKACPQNALQPALLEGGIEALWTPALTPRVGFCAPECTFCSQVCPTGAISKLTVAEKGWQQRQPQQEPVRLGVASYDHGRCIAWSSDTECGNCAKACPVAPKAIYFEEAKVVNRNGETITVKRPRIDIAHCVGCGACERFCVLRGHPAVTVSRTGESRDRTQRQILKGAGPSQHS